MAEAEAEEIQPINCSVLMYRQNIAYKWEQWFYRKVGIQNDKNGQQHYHKHICNTLELYANRIYNKQQKYSYPIFRRNHEERNRLKLVKIKQQMIAKRLQQNKPIIDKPKRNNNNDNKAKRPIPKPKLIKTEPTYVASEDPVVCSQQIFDLTQELLNTHASVDAEIRSQSLNPKPVIEMEIKVEKEVPEIKEEGDTSDTSIDTEDMPTYINSEDAVTYNENLFLNLPTSTQKN